MHYAEHPVPSALADTLRCVWTLHGDAPREAPEPQPVLPDGCAELILNMAAPFEEWQADAWSTQPMRFLYGQITRAIQLRPAGPTAMIGVRFQPWGVYRLLGPDAVRADTKLPVATIAPELDARLLQVLSGPDPEAVVPQVIAVLASLPQLTVEPTLLRFIQAIELSDTGTLDPLKTDAALSERQLERRFLAVVGLRPKLYARIIRLRRLIDLLHAGNTRGFAALAHAAGYFDQAHFNRDLKTFTGMAPRNYFGQDLVLPEYFSGVR